jgi:hypothetical protein
MTTAQSPSLPPERVQPVACVPSVSSSKSSEKTIVPEPASLELVSLPPVPPELLELAALVPLELAALVPLVATVLLVPVDAPVVEPLAEAGPAPAPPADTEPPRPVAPVLPDPPPAPEVASKSPLLP